MIKDEDGDDDDERGGGILSEEDFVVLLTLLQNRIFQIENILVATETFQYYYPFLFLFKQLVPLIQMFRWHFYKNTSKNNFSCNK